MVNKKFNKLHLWWIIPCAFIAFVMLIGLLVPTDTSLPCDAGDDEQVIANLEAGFLSSCELNKQSAEMFLTTIDLMEALGNYESSQYRATFEASANWDCNELLNNWKYQ